MQIEFEAHIERGTSPGAWSYVCVPEHVTAELGTRGLVKVAVTVEGHSFQGSFMARGGGVHMLPLRADVRSVIGKQAGDRVHVRVNQILSQ